MATPLQRQTVDSQGLPPVQSITTTPQVTDTLRPSATATRTIRPTSTATNTRTAIPLPTETDVQSSPANQPLATETNTPTFATNTATVTQTDTPTYTATATQTPSSTHTPSGTPTQTPSPTLTKTATATPTITNTPEPINVVSNSQTTPNESDGDGIPLIVIIGLVAVVLLGGYMVILAIQTAALERYAAGFIMTDCPVCQSGHLHLEERTERLIGIPRVRRVVRCDNCRSILREVGRRRWRYAIDPHEDEKLFAELNQTIISDNELTSLATERGIINSSVHYTED